MIEIDEGFDGQGRKEKRKINVILFTKKFHLTLLKLECSLEKYFLAAEKNYLSSIMIVPVSPSMNSSSFLLSGFSGLEQQYPWISIPFSTIYAMVLLGNCMVLYVIWTELSLHQPMFYFLAMLAVTDLCMGLSTVHTVLGILWGVIREISLDFCIAQSYFIHGLSFMESSYIPIISLTMVHRFGKHLSPVVHVLMGNIYILFPPLMNPIIYSVKTQQTCSRMLRLFSLKIY
nr:olfactory receptor 51V1-like [Vicugna pacos]